MYWVRHLLTQIKKIKAKHDFHASQLTKPKSFKQKRQGCTNGVHRRCVIRHTFSIYRAYSSLSGIGGGSSAPALASPFIASPILKSRQVPDTIIGDPVIWILLWRNVILDFHNLFVPIIYIFYRIQNYLQRVNNAENIVFFKRLL